MKKNRIVIGRYMTLDDDTGTEIMQLRRQIRNDVARVLEILKPHAIAVKNICEQQYWDHAFMGQVHGVALEFESTEDYIIAKILTNDLVNELRQENSPPWSGQ